MLHCPNCNVEVKPEERFCGNCGARLPEQPTTPAPRVPTGKETIVLPPVSDQGGYSPAQPASDQTLLAAPPPVPPSQIPSTTPIGPPGGYPGGNLPPGVGAPPPAKSGSSIWKILGIVAGIGVLACVALAAGVYFAVVRPASNAIATAAAGGGEFATAAAGGLATIEALPSSGALATLEALPTSDVLATLEPLVTAAAGGAADGAVLLREEFTNASRSSFDEGESDNANFTFVDGTYVVTAKQPKLITWRTARGDYGDVSIAVDATMEGNGENAAALIFHYQDDKNFYIYTVTGDGRYSLDVYKDDELTTLIDWTEAAAINPLGELNALRVDTVNDTIRLYVNDTLVDEVTDATFSRGKTAIAIYTFDDPNLTVTFDNLTIRSAR